MSQALGTDRNISRHHLVHGRLTRHVAKEDRTRVRGRPSQTAEAVCLMRASDQRRPPAERIVDDPYARWFLGPMSRATLASWEASGRWGRLAERLSPGLTAWVLTRHRYVDDCLVGALEGDVDQVVLLGAGYDT